MASARGAESTDTRAGSRSSISSTRFQVGPLRDLLGVEDDAREIGAHGARLQIAQHVALDHLARGLAHLRDAPGLPEEHGDRQQHRDAHAQHQRRPHQVARRDAHRRERGELAVFAQPGEADHHPQQQRDGQHLRQQHRQHRRAQHQPVADLRRAAQEELHAAHQHHRVEEREQHRRGREEGTDDLAQHVAVQHGRSHGAPAPMSRRKCRPRQVMESASLAARSRASARVAPCAQAVITRPPAVTSPVPARFVPAWKS